ncbi:MAG TPA: regulatory protein RecX [Chloroflexota bacterium]|nr:regulatory protein RecX [Chloroflexota bacterium]
MRVQLAGRESVELSLQVVEEAGLRPGMALDDLALDDLRQRDEFQETVERALRFLESRPRSEREVRTRLAQKGTPPGLVDRVVARLRELKLIDDDAFAAFWIENRNRFRPKGARAIKAELRQKGLADDVIAEQVEDGLDEEAGARVVALRQARRYAKLDYPTFRQKLWAYLARRGFDFDAISSAIEEAWRSVGAENTLTTDAPTDEGEDAED